jgi:hypothetical protein
VSSRQSEGIVQVFTNDPREINDALATITNRLDHLKGLRGRTEVWDRIRASDPTADQDVLTRGSLQTIAQVVFLSSPFGLFIRMPGVSFVEPFTDLRRKYNFTGGQAGTARLCMFGWGTESGTKSLRVTNGTTILSTLTWSGTTETLRVSDSVPIDVSTDDSLRLTCALSTATESLVLGWVMLELGG